MSFWEVVGCIVALLCAGGFGILLGMFEKELSKLEIMDYERSH